MAGMRGLRAQAIGYIYMASKTEIPAIEFEATVEKVATHVSGAIRVWVDIDGSNVMQAAQLIECMRPGIVVQIRAQPKVSKKTYGKGKIVGRRAAKEREPKGDNSLQ